MDQRHCLQLVRLLQVIIFSMLLNVLKQALNVQSEDVQEVTKELQQFDQEPRSCSASVVDNVEQLDRSVPFARAEG